MLQALRHKKVGQTIGALIKPGLSKLARIIN